MAGKKRVDERTSTKRAGEVEDAGEIEGEGSRSADRAYREHVREFLDENDPLELGRKAERETDAKIDPWSD